MKINLRKLSVCAVWLAFSQTSALAEVPAGQYTILPDVYLDTSRDSISWLEGGSIRSGKIVDCSDAAYYCLDSERLSLVWPKTCETLVASDSSWSLGGVTTRVVGYTNRVVHHTGLTARLPLVMTDGQPHSAFVLDNGRIRGVLTATKGNVDLRSKIAAINSENKFDLIDILFANSTYSPVLSSGRLGRCEDSP